MSSIRQQIRIAVSNRAVWSALTTAEGMQTWYAQEARMDARPGGRIVLKREIDGVEQEEAGIFHTLRPTRQIEIAWDTNSRAPTKGSRVQFLVGRDGDETKLHVIHAGGELLGDEEARAELEARWKEDLLRLRDLLEA